MFRTDARPSLASQTLALVVLFAITFSAAAVGALASIEAKAFFAQLTRPAWAPPGWLFGPVWTLLYTLMALAAWQVWRSGGWHRSRGALTLYLIQLVANALWSWLFFAWRLGPWALAEILLLWVLILATLIAFWRIRRMAGVLLLPYLAWVAFASVLTFVLWRANPALLG